MTNCTGSKTFGKVSTERQKDMTGLESSKDWLKGLCL